MHFLQRTFDSTLGKIVQYLVPSHRFISVHDLFNPELFHACLMRTIAGIPELNTQLETLMVSCVLKEGEREGQSGYVQLRLHNFLVIWQCIRTVFQYLNVPIGREMGKQNLFRLVKECDMQELQILLQYLFELIIRNHKIVEFITFLPEEDQSRIKDFVQKVKEKTEAGIWEEKQKMEGGEWLERRQLQEENAEFRNLVISKENELNRAHVQIMELQEQIVQLRESQMMKEGNIENLKKRLLAYEETETLFQEKDEEISRLHKQMGELQLSNRLLSSELSTQKGKWQLKVRQLQEHNTELQMRFDKTFASFDLLSRQKEEIESSNRKVIANLKEKIKSLTDRVNELQGQLVQVRISGELRERQFNELLSTYQSLKSQSVFNEGMIRRDSRVDRSGLCSSGRKQFLKLGDELNEIERMQENAFEEEIMMFQSGEENVRKIQEIISENAKLKERISNLESSGQKDLKQDNERLRKRLAVMKKRNQELQGQRREELQLMVSAFQQCLRPSKVQ